MRRLVLAVIIVVSVMAFIPARALNRGLVYGFVLSPSGPFGPVRVQTYNFGIVMVDIPPNVTTSSLYLGADVCCEVGSDGNLIIADLPNDSRNYVDKRSWLAQITIWDAERFNYWVTSPAGAVQLLVDSELVRSYPLRVGSHVRVTAIKSPWAERYTAIDLRIVSW